jgi:hypothetical protein
MRTKLALASALAVFVCVPTAHAISRPGPPSYPQCDTRTYAGAVCAVRANIVAYNPGYGSPLQAVRCYWAERTRHAFRRWSCHTAQGRRAVVFQRTGQVMWMLVLSTAGSGAGA